MKEKKFIAYCEQYYFLRNKGFPTVEEAAKNLNYSPSEIQTFMKNREVQKAFERRGLPWKTAGKLIGRDTLSPEQIAAGSLMVNFADTRSPEEKLEDLGVQPAQYFAWLEDPVFYEYVNSIASRNLDKIRPEAITQFAQLIRKGNFKAIQYYFDVTGQFKTPETQNLTAVIQKLIEAVQKHVKDPEVLAAIAKDVSASAPIASESAQLEITAEYSEEEQTVMRQFTGGRV